MLYIERVEVRKTSSEPSGPSDGGKSACSANDLCSDNSSDDQGRSDDTRIVSSERNALKRKASDDTDASDDKSRIPYLACAHCGKPGGLPVAYGDRQAILHQHCRDAWIAAQDAVFNPRLRLVAGSSQ